MDINDFDDAEKLRIILAAVFMHGILAGGAPSVHVEANARAAVDSAGAVIQTLEEK